MARRRTGPHERAHCALEDWASFLWNTNTSQELGFQIAQLEVERVQTPPKALIPRIAFTPPMVKAVQNWYDTTTKCLRTTAYMYYLAEVEEKRKVTRRQYNYLIANVSRYLTGLS